MMSRVQGEGGCGSMIVIRRTDDDCIQVFSFQHLPVVVESLRFRKSHFRLSEIIVVNIAKRDDVFALNSEKVVSASIRYADNPDVELLIGTFRLRLQISGERRYASCDYGPLQKFSSIPVQ